jgi:hypothetical protein
MLIEKFSASVLFEYGKRHRVDDLVGVESLAAVHTFAAALYAIALLYGP